MQEENPLAQKDILFSQKVNVLLERSKGNLLPNQEEDLLPVEEDRPQGTACKTSLIEALFERGSVEPFLRQPSFETPCTTALR